MGRRKHKGPMRKFEESCPVPGCEWSLTIFSRNEQDDSAELVATALKNHCRNNHA